MTPFMKLLRNTSEKLFGKFYEGPVTPDRFEQTVIAFMKMNPKATRQDWASFCARHADEAYASGYQRGYEWAERDLDRKPDQSPEVEEHHNLHAWRWNGLELVKDYDEGDLDEVVIDEDGEEAVRRHLDEYERALRAQQDSTPPMGKRFSR